MTAIKETRGDYIFKVINYCFLGLVTLVILYPLFYIVIASVSDPTLVNQGKVWLWPKGFNVLGYKMILESDQIWIGYRNTVFYTVFGVAINLAITLPAAYALSRKSFVGGGFLMAMFVFTMFFSGGLIPTYLLVKNLGMINTIWAMVLPNAVAVWNLIVCRTFFQSTIPKELEEAATIDGCSNTKLFFKIVLPLSAPIIAVMALFYGVAHWNAYFEALIYLSDKSLYPLQLVLRQILVLQDMSTVKMSSATVQAMQDKQAISAIMKYAVMIVACLPLIVIYPFIQRFFVKGVMIGSLKG